MKTTMPTATATATSSSSAAAAASGSNTFYDTIPATTRITIQNHDHGGLNGLQGCILSYDRRTCLYTVMLDNTVGSDSTKLLTKPTTLFQNVIVCLRAYMAQELGGVFIVTLLSSSLSSSSSPYYYQARYNRPSTSTRAGKMMTTVLCPEHFIIPNGTVVRLVGLNNNNGTYGTIVDWKEGLIDRYTRGDESYYEVRLSDGLLVRVKMENVAL
mmetsp:Transcript_30424/g.64409  ORF Transcript_30424/g.64409 Transcript_30424/m.64409 type:complete len:213 (+) Transcript_30424:1247-1885(+)